MKTKVLFGGLLLCVAICSRVFSGDCCAQCCAPASCAKACGCESGCGSGCCCQGHVAEWLKAVFTVKCKTCILCQNPPAPEAPAAAPKTDAAPAPAAAPKTDTAPLPAAPSAK